MPSSNPMAGALVAAIFEQSIVGVVISDSSGVIRDANDAFSRMVGRPRHELVGQTSRAFTHTDDVGLTQAELDRLRQHADALLHKRYVHTDGRLVYCRITLSNIRGVHGEVDGLVALVEDITDSVDSASALADARQRLESNLRVTEVGTWTWDVERDRVVADRNLARLFGVSDQAAQGGVIAEYIANIDERDRQRVSQTIGHALDKADRYEVEYRVTAHGTTRWLLARGHVERDATGKAIQLPGVALDITERRRVEEQLEAARADVLAAERAARAEAERASRMKDEFVAMLSHELRTPLNSILGWTHLARQADATPAMIEQGLAVIERNARSQAEIIEDLLDMTRIMTGKVQLSVEVIELGDVIRAAVDTARPMAEAKRIGLHLALDPAASRARGDASRLQQVFWNLLSNAVKFSAENRDVRVVSRLHDDTIEVSVIDSGEGIPSDFIDKVFDRFRQADNSTTRRHGGLGLGLAITRQLVEMHGGVIRASSDGPGQGATFTVTLPRALVVTSTPQTAIDEHSLGISLKGLTLVVVDDEPDARELLARLLETRGARVIACDGAATALEAMQRERPDVLVSDIGMPDQDGYDLIRMVRTSTDAAIAQTPAIAVTAYARAEDRIRAIVAGFQVHLSKPFEPLELVTQVAGLVRR